VGAVTLRTDDDVFIVDGLHELIETGTESAGDRDQLVEGHATPPGLDPAQRGGARVTACREGIK
jgi:hypothetical protein